MISAHTHEREIQFAHTSIDLKLCGCAFVSVCVCMCMYVCVCVHVCIYLHVCVRACVVCVCVCVCVRTCTEASGRQGKELIQQPPNRLRLGTKDTVFIA